jgi:arylsulfatase A-like enzyme
MDDFLEYTDEDNRDLMPDEMHARWAVQKIGTLDTAHSEQPFFIGIGFVRPHTPLYAPKRFFDMFPLEELELSPIQEGDAADTHYKDIYPADIKGLRYYGTLKESYGGDAELGLKHFLQAYLACVAFVDEQIGLVIDAVNKSRFRDNTIVVLTSDHGWQMGEKDYLFKNSAWEESTRIPLVIRWPGASLGAVVDHPVSLIDLFPTLVDLCRLSGDHRRNADGLEMDGHSLKPFLQDPDTEQWAGLGGALSMIGVGLNSEGMMKQTYAYRNKNWRYIRYIDGSEELYDHINDPYEWVNLAEVQEFSDTLAILRQQMMEIIRTSSGFR